MNTTAILKSVIREPYAWPGGYERFLVMDDGECICYQCARAEYRIILQSTRCNARDGWTVAGASMDCETDVQIDCAHCNRVIIEGEIA